MDTPQCLFPYWENEVSLDPVDPQKGSVSLKVPSYASLFL